MRRQKIVGVGKGDLDTSCTRLITRSPHQGIQPDHAVTARAQAAHLEVERGGVARLPAVADEEEHGALAKDSARVATIEGTDALADTRAAGEVDDRAGGVGKRGVDIANLELPGNGGEPRPKDESLGLAM